MVIKRDDYNNPILTEDGKIIPINKCECGSEKFVIDEHYTWLANFDEESNLDCGYQEGGINSIECAECGKQFSEEDFNQINF